MMYVFRDCSKFTSVFTLCALSVDRFLASFHQLGRYRQIRVGVTICASIWIACLAISSPDWIFGSTVERSRRSPAPGTNLAARTGNATTAHAPDSAYGDNALLDHLQASNLDLTVDPDFDLDATYGADRGSESDLAVDLDPERWRRDDRRRSRGSSNVQSHCDLDPERLRPRSNLSATKTMCKLEWSSIRSRKTWTYALLVVGLFVPLVAIAIFNVLLVYRMRTLHRNKQKAGVQRTRRLANVARMVLVVVIIFTVCQLPYHVMEIISLQVVGSTVRSLSIITKVVPYSELTL